MKGIDQKCTPFKNPIMRINLKDADLRTGPKDRRKMHTYFANDRRNGIADRRKSIS